jgi:hypothetical protein
VDEIGVESLVELTSSPEQAASEGLPTPHDGLAHRLVVLEGEAGSTPHPHPPPLRSKASWEAMVRTYVTPDEMEEPGDGWHEAYAALSEQVGAPSLPSRSSVALSLTAV